MAANNARTVGGLLGVLSCSIAIAACGGYDGSAFDNPGGPGPDASGTDTSTNPDAIATDSNLPPGDSTGVDTTPPPAGVTLDNVCAKMADVICTSPLETCCSSKSITYTSSGCKAALMAECALDVAAAKAGTEKFDPTKFDGCAAAYAALIGKCSFTGLEFIKQASACSALFNGTTPYGGACTRDSQCNAPAGAYANCNETGHCDSIAVVGKDAACTYAGPAVRFCDAGLYCSSGTGTGTCRVAKPAGASCAGTWDSSCGFGNSCVTYRCAPGLGFGAACYDNLQCASWDCQANKCTDPMETIASPGLCHGGG